MTEHRWKDITGGAVDDDDWRTLRTLPAFGDGTPASLALGEVTRLAPAVSSLSAYFEVYDGQGVGAAPVTPTPAVTATLEVVTAGRDLAGNDVYSVGPAVNLTAAQRRAIEPEVPPQGVSWVRITSIAGALPDPGSIRLFVDEGTKL
jgi:hypothetical protein